MTELDLIASLKLKKNCFIVHTIHRHRKTIHTLKTVVRVYCKLIISQKIKEIKMEDCCYSHFLLNIYENQEIF